MKESEFQKKVIDEIEERLPGAIVMKNDPNYIQGIPDLTVLYKDRWAALETKKSEKAKRRPNQSYYVNKMNEMSYSAFIYPENMEETLNAMERSFKARRTSRNTKPK